MGNAFSKLSELHIWNSVNHNCYEGIHTWDPSCGRVFVHQFVGCMKAGSLVYLPFYLIPQLLAIKWRGRRNMITGDQNNNNLHQQEEDQQNEKKRSERKEGEEGRKCGDAGDASAEQGKHADAAEDSPVVAAAVVVVDGGSPDLISEIADRLKCVVSRTLISSSVVAVNTSLIIGLTCIQNHLTGKVFYFSPFVSSLFSHYCSFTCEKASRRNSLTMFVIKTFFESLYRMLRQKDGVIQDLGRGSKSEASKNEKTAAVLLFSSSLALNFYFMNRNSSTRDPLMSILSFIVGPEGAAAGATGSVLHKVRGGRGGGEERNVRETNSSQEQEPAAGGGGEESMPHAVRGSGRSCGDDECVSCCRDCSANVIHKEFRAGNQDMEQEDGISQGVVYKKQKKCSNHSHDAGHSSCRRSSPSSSPTGTSSPLSPPQPPSCRHALLTVTSCPTYALTGAVQMFMIGWTIQVSLNLFKKRKRALSSGSALVQEVLFHADSFKFALFLSNLSLIYRSSSCALHRFKRPAGDDSVSRMISGFLSGLSMFFYPSTQIALHTFWKTMFTMYFMKFGHTRGSQLTVDTLFCIMDSLLLNTMVMEPQFLPPSFLRVIDSFTGSYLTKFNVVSIFKLGGRDNRFRYGNKLPELNADHVSRTYMETVGSWGLERHGA